MYIKIVYNKYIYNCLVVIKLARTTDQFYAILSPLGPIPIYYLFVLIMLTLFSLS